MKKWSESRKPGHPYQVHFKKAAEYDLPVWKSAFFLSIEQRSITQFTKDKKLFYAIAGADNPIIQDFESNVTKFLDEIKNPKWRTFKTYSSNMHRILIIEFKMDNWQSSSCSCPFFMKHHKCKHIAFLAVNNKLCSFPPAAKALEIPCKTSNGRIEKAKPALQLQPNNDEQPRKKKKIIVLFIDY